MMIRSKQHGFTLVELAIVLVIIGLIVGGVLVGQDMIRGAELRGLITQSEKYQAAVNTFRNKYNALPGDMRNATDVWGAADADFTDCKTTQGTGTQTCNGNGDNIVSGLGGTDQWELFRFFQQLAIANLIEGSYTGIISADAAESVPGENIPGLTTMDGGSMFMVYLPRVAADANVYDGLYNHTFAMGIFVTGTSPLTPLLSPVDMLNLDTKMDDGLPPTGSVRPFKSPMNPGCTTADDGTALYDTATLTVACTVMISSRF